jgi:hypothetical protein
MRRWVMVGPNMRPFGPGPVVVGPARRRRRLRRLGVFGLVRGLFVLPLAAVLLAGGATNVFAHDGEHDEVTGAEASEAVSVAAEADAILIQVGEDIATDEHAGHDDGAVELTVEEQEVIDELVAAAQATAEQFADVAAAEAAGYLAAPFKSVRGTTLLQTHAMNVDYFRDGRELDPAFPEGLMYVQFPDGETVLVALVFTAEVGEGPTPAGDAFAWHTHYGCTVAGEPRALPAGVETCPDGTPGRAPRREMLHLWTFAHPDGPFAHGFTGLAARVVIEAYG